jgi:amicyanin
MNKKIVVTVIVVVIIIGAYYLFANKGSNGSPTYTSPATNTSAPVVQTEPTPVVTTANNATAPAAQTVNVDIKNFTFKPDILTVKVGTIVVWTNNDSVPHTVTSDSGSPLNSPTLSKGQSFSFTFTEAGSFSYHCAIHPMMKGTVVVTN